MTSSPELHITEEVFNSFDAFDKALAIVLEKAGQVSIIRENRQAPQERVIT